MTAVSGSSTTFHIVPTGQLEVLPTLNATGDAALTTHTIIANPTSQTVGLVVDNFNFGMAMMKPTLAVDFAKYFALSATADGISLYGIDNVTVSAHNILVEVNQSTPSVYGVPIFPVVNFAGTYGTNERQTLFTVLDANGDHTLQTTELNTALSNGYTGADITTPDQLFTLLNASPSTPDGILTVDEVVGKLKDAFKSTDRGNTDPDQSPAHPGGRCGWGWEI